MDRLLSIRNSSHLVAVSRVPVNIAIDFADSFPEYCSPEYKETIRASLYSFRMQGRYVKLVFKDGLLSYSFIYDWAAIPANVTYWFDELPKEQVEDFDISSLDSLL